MKVIETRVGYKKTKLGWIPEEWEFKYFEEITDITRLAGYEYSEYWKENESEEIIALRGFNVGKGKLELYNLAYISNELSLKLIRSRLAKGDIVYPCVGSIGNAAVIDKNDTYHIQQNIAKISCKHNSDPYFITQFLLSDLSVKEVLRFNATSSQPNVLVGSLRKYRIALPTLPEQQKIAQILSTWDKGITKLEQLISQKQLLKKGLMQQLLTGKKRFPEFVSNCDSNDSMNTMISKNEKENHSASHNQKSHSTDDWKEVKLGDVVEIMGGGTPDTDNESFWNGSIQWFTPSELKSKYVFKSKRTITVEGLQKSSAKILPINTLLLSSRATIAEVSIALLECTTNQGFQSILPSNSYSTEFLYYWIKLKKHDFIRRSSGSTFLEISKKEISKIRIKIPSFEEQNKIGLAISKSDQEIEQLQNQLIKLQEQKKGLMQKLLTGEVRVKV